MNVAVEIFEIFAAMADHRSRKSRHRFRRNFDRAGSEKLVVWKHEANVERPTPNVQRLSQIAVATSSGDMYFDGVKIILGITVLLVGAFPMQADSPNYF